MMGVDGCCSMLQNSNDLARNDSPKTRCPGTNLMTSRRSALLCSFFVFIALTSTSCETPVRGLVADEFSAAMNKIGLVAVMPPREDVRVGDLYAYGSNPDASRNPALLSAGADGAPYHTRWGSLNLLTELDREYQGRPAWPETPDAYFKIASDPRSRSWAEATTASPQSLYQPGQPPQRMRTVSLDTAIYATFIKGDLESLIPTEAMNLALGTSWRDSKAVTLKATSAESYSLPINAVLDKLVEEFGEGGGYFVRPEYRSRLPLIAKGNLAWIRVVTEVVYIRSIDVAIQAREESEEDQDLEASELQTAGEQVEKESAADDGLDPAFGAFVRADSINKLLIDSDNDDLPGGFVRFLSVSDDSISLRHIWQRGLALGVRGLTLEVNAQNGNVLRVWPMGQRQGRDTATQQTPKKK